MSGEEFSSFLREVGKRRLLTRSEEVELGRRVQAGDKAAKDRMVEHNLKLVISIAKRYASMFEIEELVQEGTVGLLKAVERFDPEKGFKFSTYATWWIKQAIHRYMATRTQIRVPARLQKARRELTKRMANHGESLKEAATALNMDYDEAVDAIEGPRVSVSLDSAMSDDGADDRYGMIPDPNSTDPAEAMPEHHIELRDAMAELPERQRKVLELRFGFNGPVRGRDDIAQELGVGGSVVQKEQKAALIALERKLAMRSTSSVDENVELRIALSTLREEDSGDVVCER